MTESPERAPIAPTDRLYVPHRKRLKHAYITNEQGNKELRIDYGMKEVSFDEERFFSFGEQLVRLPSFVAGDATTWGPGYAWEEVHPLLEALRDEGIVKTGEVTDDQRGGGLVPSPLAPSVCPMARMWSAEEALGITRDLAGREVEVGHLEAIVPVFRIAHPAMDEDDRQVGEANVFPQRLRLDRETEWRVCQYPGSRYQDDGPMNVTALRAMIKHWKAMMVALMQIREELQRRMLRERTQWTVGDLMVLSCAVLSLPAYSLLKRGGTSPQKPLHPVLSSLFRITDGIRMVTYEMLFLLTETPRSPHEPMTGQQIYEYAEQHGLFITSTGVCAGPKPLIDEFLANAVDGVPIQDAYSVEVPQDVKDALAELPDALEYGLMGIQVWAIGQAILVVMSHATEAMLGILERAQAKGPLGEAGERLLARLQVDWQELIRQQITLEYDRDIHMIAYVDAYERSRGAQTSPVSRPTLAEALARRPEDASHRAAVAQLKDVLEARLTEGAAACAEEMAEALVRYCREEQEILTSAGELLAAINKLLERPEAKRPLTIRDFMVFYLLRERRFVYLFESLEEELGVWVESTATKIEVAGRDLAAKAAG
ncbi:MAG: hypothetical protein R3B48_15930 [Kofleriaceae bacterium]